MPALHIPISTPDTTRLLEVIASDPQLVRRVPKYVIMVSLKTRPDGTVRLHYSDIPSPSPVTVLGGEIDARNWPKPFVIVFRLAQGDNTSFPNNAADALWVNPDRDQNEPDPNNALEKKCVKENNYYSSNTWQFVKARVIENNKSLKILYGNYTRRKEYGEPHYYYFHHYRLNIDYNGQTLCPDNDPVIKNGDGLSPNSLEKFIERYDPKLSRRAYQP